MRRVLTTVVVPLLLLSSIPARGGHEDVRPELSVEASAPRLSDSGSWYSLVTVYNRCVTLWPVVACSPTRVSLRYHYWTSSGIFAEGYGRYDFPSRCLEATGGCAVNLPIPSNAEDWWVEASQLRCAPAVHPRRCSTSEARAPHDGVYPKPQ